MSKAEEYKGNLTPEITEANQGELAPTDEAIRELLGDTALVKPDLESAYFNEEGLFGTRSDEFAVKSRSDEPSKMKDGGGTLHVQRETPSTDLVNHASRNVYGSEYNNSPDGSNGPLEGFAVGDFHIPRTKKLGPFEFNNGTTYVVDAYLSGRDWHYSHDGAVRRSGNKDTSRSASTEYEVDKKGKVVDGSRKDSVELVSKSDDGPTDRRRAKVVSKGENGETVETTVVERVPRRQEFVLGSERGHTKMKLDSPEAEQARDEARLRHEQRRAELTKKIALKKVKNATSRRDDDPERHEEILPIQ